MKSIICLAIFYMVYSFSAGAQNVDTVSIYFKQNQAEVTKESASILDSFFIKNNGHFIAVSIDLLGYCDTLGSDQYNLQLSYKRVDAVKTHVNHYHLLALTYNEIKGFGEMNVSYQDYADYKPSLNRCVKIIIHHTDRDIIKPASPQPNLPIKKPTIVPDIIRDTMFEIGTNVKLDNLLFFGNSHYPLPQSMVALNQLLKVFQTNLQLKVEIQGFICCTSDGMELADSETGTYDLSLQRAKYVYDFLVKNKIDPARLSYKGLGGSNKYLPIESNRRIEFKIVDK